MTAGDSATKQAPVRAGEPASLGRPEAASGNGQADGAGRVLAGRSTQPRWVATTVAVAVMVVYVAALWVLFGHRADKNWDRIVYLFSGFEAIVFVAVGAVFGTTAQRASVEAAQAQAHDAQIAAKSETGRANRAVARGAGGDALAGAIRSYAGSRSGGPAGGHGTPPGSAGRGMRGPSPVADPALDLLVSLADELFPREA